MNKYYTTITYRVVVQANDKGEALDTLDELTEKVTEVLDVQYVDVVDAEVKITDVK